MTRLQHGSSDGAEAEAEGQFAYEEEVAMRVICDDGVRRMK